MKFVKHNNGDAFEILCSLRQTNEETIGHKKYFCLRAFDSLISRAISHKSTFAHSHLECNSSRDGACRQASRLQHHDATIACDTRFQQDLRDLGGFSRTSLCNEHQFSIDRNSLNDLFRECVDRQGISSREPRLRMHWSNACERLGENAKSDLAALDLQSLRLLSAKCS